MKVQARKRAPKPRLGAKVPKTKPAAPIPENQPRPQPAVRGLDPLQRYMREYRVIRDQRGRAAGYRYAVDQFTQAYGPVPAGTEPALVHLRHAYELEAAAAQAAQPPRVLGAQFEKNLEELRAWNGSGLVGHTGDLLRVELATRFQEVRQWEERRGTMAKKSAKGKGEAPAAREGSVSGYLCEVYWSNNKTKYTDAQVLSMAEKKFPKAKLTLGNVTRIRRRLNVGRYKHYGKPAQPIQKFEDGGKKATPAAAKKPAPAVKKPVPAAAAKKPAPTPAPTKVAKVAKVAKPAAPAASA